MMTCDPKRQNACASSQPSGTAADHQQTARTFDQVEDILVGQISGFGQSRNRRGQGPRAGRDERLLEAERCTGHRDRVGPGKSRRAEIHIDARFAQSPCRSGPAQARLQPPHALHHRWKADADRARHLCAEIFRIAHFRIEPRGAYDRLRRHATDIQAVAADEIALDERHLRAQCGRFARRRQPARPRADDDEIVFAREAGVAPSGGMNIVLERATDAIAGRTARRRVFDAPSYRLALRLNSS